MKVSFSISSIVNETWFPEEYLFKVGENMMMTPFKKFTLQEKKWKKQTEFWY